MMVAARIIGAIILIHLISFLINQARFRNELKGIAPYGKLVEVKGKYMHVYSMGRGEKTIVLLPGHGIPLPSADFGPLMRELAENYTLVCVEYFGYGFSDQTDAPRTNETLTEEIRTALSLAGYKPPYILMPFSASGMYSEYYAATYPSEVSALILLDTSSTAEKDTVPKFVYRLMYGLARLQLAIGLLRPINNRQIPKALAMTEENGYTKKEIDDFVKFANHGNNRTVTNEALMFGENSLGVMATTLPKDIPVLMIGADGYEKGKWAKYRNAHLKKLGEHAQYKLISNSTHSDIYHNRRHRQAVCEAVEQFIAAEL